MPNRQSPLCAISLLLILLLGALYVGFSMFPVAYASTLTVPNPYSTIQAAIDAARDGDTILVSRRTGEAQSVYYERIVINKQLIIIGESRDTIIIDGNKAGTVVQIQAHYVQFKGFTVRNGGLKYSGVRANSYSYLDIANNRVETCRYGIVLLNSLFHKIVSNIAFNNSIAGISLSDCLSNNVTDNNVSESAYGIELSSSNATFVVSNAVSNTSYGIYIEYSHNNTVDGNTLLRNKIDGIFPFSSYDIIVKNNEIHDSAYGIQLYQSTTVTILGNTATYNGYGVYVAYSGPLNTVVDNTLSRNDWGVTLYGSSFNTITGNTLSYNTYGVDTGTDSNNNVFYHNNFIDNAQQAVWNPYCSNTWDNGYPSGGNYWSDYTGTDANKDGIGDTPYTIDPNNQDRYPLMTMWRVIRDVAILEVTISATWIYIGRILNIAVVVKNKGNAVETFPVTVKYNSTIIETRDIVSLAPGANTTLTFNWNTSAITPPATCTISAEAAILPGETNTTDNFFVDGTVKVCPVIIGDVNGDGSVTIFDLALVAKCYGTEVGDSRYNAAYDLNKDGKIWIEDISIVARDYGKSVDP